MKLLISAILLTAAAFAQQAPRLYSNDGKGVFLGNLSANTVDPYSTSNPVGIYGSPVSPLSINNPVGIYGSPVSPYSARNPVATSAPIIVAPRSTYPTYSTPSWSSLPSLSTKCCSDWSW
jgi:hypothetical protein